MLPIVFQKLEVGDKSMWGLEEIIILGLVFSLPNGLSKFWANPHDEASKKALVTKTISGHKSNIDSSYPSQLRWTTHSRDSTSRLVKKMQRPERFNPNPTAVFEIQFL